MQEENTIVQVAIAISWDANVTMIKRFGKSPDMDDCIDIHTIRTTGRPAQCTECDTDELPKTILYE